MFQKAYRIPPKAVLEVHGPNVYSMDVDKLAMLVVLYPLMFQNVLRLPFYCPLRDILNFLRLTPTQLAPNAWHLIVVVLPFISSLGMIRKNTET